MADNYSATGTVGPSANVGFKLGSQNNLDSMAANSATNGTFYLTSDTHRLYIGNSDGTVSPVNEGVITVGNVADLPSLSASVDQLKYSGRFYYVTEKNVLCVASGSNWVQINPDNNYYLTTLTDTVSTSSGIATVTTSGTLNTSSSAGSASFTIQGGNGNTVSSSNNAITISGDTYGISASANATKGADLKLNSTNTTNDSSVNIVGSGATTVSVSNGVITISSTDTKTEDNNTTNKTLTADPTDNGGNGFLIQVEDEDGGTVSDTLDPTITINSTAKHFVNGDINLGDIYSKTEVDSKIADKLTALNAMTYKGTVAGADNLPSSSVSIGDVYLTTVETTYKTVEYPVHTLFIAKGTEGTDGYITSGTLSWDAVSSADEIDTTYWFTAISKGIVLTSSTDSSDETNKLTFKDGNKISISSSNTSGKAQEITIDHSGSKPTAVTGTAQTQTAKGNLTFTVPAIETDDYGHVTKITSTSYTAQDTDTHATITHSDSTDASISNNIVTVTDTAEITVDGASLGSEAGSFTLGSSSLTLGATAKTSTAPAAITMNLTWGSF